MRRIMFRLMVLFLVGSTFANDSRPIADEVKAVTKKVADWQLSTFHEHGKYRAIAKDQQRQNNENKHDLVWENGALYAGLNQWRMVADDPSTYTDFLLKIAERNEWKLHKRPYNADDHTVGQLYLSFYEDFNKSAMLVPTQEHFDWILDNPKIGSLEWSGYGKNKNRTDCHKRWGWCDALFMAPPVWARLAKVTGEQKYLDFMNQEYHATYDLLWDKEEHLFWRDSSYFPKREKNGRKLFWARGNGWVFGGLALMIPDLPKDWEGRAFYIDLFKSMAESIKNCQRADGTWSMGLLGGLESYPIKETSGTSFCTFGLAWGVNQGLLDHATYEPIIFRAWNALTDCVTKEGLLGYVQPVGAAPGDSYADKTEVYGVGAFLAAGAEVYRLVDITVPSIDSEVFQPYWKGTTENAFKAKLGVPLVEGGFRREGFNLWDPSIIKVGETYHLFASCWPSADFNKWKQSYIVRATSKNLLGPYEFSEEVFRPRGGDYFDAIGCHNPKITSHGGQYLLYHIGIPSYKSGVAVSDSIEGPWKRQEKWSIPANNPALWIHEDGSVYGVGRVKVNNPDYDANSKKRSHEKRLLLQGIKADTIFGPYQQLHAKEENALPENYENEDPCIWYADNRYHILVTDWGGYATGESKAFTYYTSKDGLTYELVSKDPILVRSDPIHFSDGSTFKYSRIERPNVVLNEEGQVVALLASALPINRIEGSRILVFPVDHFGETTSDGIR